MPEVLLVPLYLGGKVPLGTLWIVSDQEGHFDSGHARSMTELASFVGIALRMVRSEEQLQHALSEQETLAREMSHRVKNLFAVTDALIRLSARGAADKDEMAKLLSGRVHALASAHSLVRRSFNDIGLGPRASDLRALVKTILEPHEEPAESPSRFSIEGPPIRCGDHAINGVALVFHELATNAAKYGALTVVDGHIDINWKQRDEILAIVWVERNGPPIEDTPTINGFGSVLARTTIVGQFGGTLDYDWQREGLIVTIVLPINALSA